jgi:hypothetical protein
MALGHRRLAYDAVESRDGVVRVYACSRYAVLAVEAALFPFQFHSSIG